MSFKSISYLLPILLFTIAIEGKSQQLISPCPEIFFFNFQEDGVWNATLVLKYPLYIHGIYILLYFDQAVEEFSVQDGFGGRVVNLDASVNQAFMIKNKNGILKADCTVQKKIQILVRYRGNAPNLKEFRINGYLVCPNSNSGCKDSYPSDPKAGSKYLESLAHETALYSSNKCGIYEGTIRLPWQASLFTITDKNKYSYTCEAVLISPKYLVTSAHCVTYLNTTVSVHAEKLAVYFSVKNIGEIAKRQPVKISNVILYPGYQPQNLLNDIALLQLKIPTEAMPACLPSEMSDEKAEETLVGFNMIKNMCTTISSAVLNKIPQENCFKNKALKAFLGDNTYCATHANEKSRTIGDSGSGSFVEVNGRVHLKGLVTISEALLNDNSRNIIFIDVYKFEKWLRHKLAQ